MESRGILDVEALGAFVPEALVPSEPEILFVLALAGLVQLLRPYLVLLLTHSNSALGLTRREIEVLAWVAAGKTNAETAELLSIAPGTVKKHLDHIYAKLGVGTRTEAVVKHSPHRARGEAEAELDQLTSDPLIAPARVLPRQPHHQLAQRLVRRWTAGFALLVCPLPAHQLPMPTQ
jgi:DNA-binding CsgD family transcriptional regulator